MSWTPSSCPRANTKWLLAQLTWGRDEDAAVAWWATAAKAVEQELESTGGKAPHTLAAVAAGLQATNAAWPRRTRPSAVRAALVACLDLLADGQLTHPGSSQGG